MSLRYWACEVCGGEVYYKQPELCSHSEWLPRANPPGISSMAYANYGAFAPDVCYANYPMLDPWEARTQEIVQSPGANADEDEDSESDVTCANSDHHDEDDATTVDMEPKMEPPPYHDFDFPRFEYRASSSDPDEWTTISMSENEPDFEDSYVCASGVEVDEDGNSLVY